MAWPLPSLVKRSKVPGIRLENRAVFSTSMRNKNKAAAPVGKAVAWAEWRPDLWRALALTVVVVLLWCQQFDRWTVQSWQTPVTYLGDPVKGDIFVELAYIRAARDGHISIVFDNSIPELGAPNTGNWNDFPLVEKPMIIATGLLARVIGLFPAANFSLMMAQVLAALGFYAAARWLGTSWAWAAAGAIAVAFSRYAYSHGMHHLTVVYFWQVPLGLAVCYELARGRVRLGERNFIYAVVVAVLMGMQHVYYTYLFAQLAVLAGLYRAARGGWRQLLPAVAMVGAAFAAFLLMDLNTILYNLIHGGGAALDRPYKWLEIYGLKLVDLVVPPPDHPFPPFADWGTAHFREVFLSPGELPPSGYIGIVGLAALGWLVAVSWQRVVRRELPPIEAWMILWIILMANVGGLNSILGTLGFELIRSATRYSLFILCLVLFFAGRRLSAMEWPGRNWACAVAAAVALFAYWEQSPPGVTDQQVTAIAQQVDSDRRFVEAMENQLPPGAMVFQLPLQDFPESPMPGVGAYEQLRPYLFAHQLRFSFGSDKGRPDTQWQHELAQMPFNDILQELQQKGFAAICIERSGYQDNAAGLVKVLHDDGYKTTIESDHGDLVCVILKK